ATGASRRRTTTGSWARTPRPGGRGGRCCATCSTGWTEVRGACPSEGACGGGTDDDPRGIVLVEVGRGARGGGAVTLGSFLESRSTDFSQALNVAGESQKSPVEALIGVLYPAVLIGRLVSLERSEVRPTSRVLDDVDLDAGISRRRARRHSRNRIAARRSRERSHAGARAAQRRSIW